MRNISTNYIVTYSLVRRKMELLSKKQVACFRDLYGISAVINTDELHLKDFLVVETHEYAKVYLDLISKICGVKITHVEENHIIITDIKSLFIAKVFTTLYRILFEVKTTYGSDVKIKDIANKIAFLEDFVNRKTYCRYKDPLKRFIHFHNTNDIFMGPGHGIKRTEKGLNSLKTIKDLNKFVSFQGCRVQDFFTE